MNKLPPKAYVMLLLLRCGYIEIGHSLTPKGRGVLPQAFWRWYVRWRWKLDPEFRRLAMQCLEWACDGGHLTQFYA